MPLLPKLSRLMRLVLVFVEIGLPVQKIALGAYMGN